MRFTDHGLNSTFLYGHFPDAKIKRTRFIFSNRWRVFPCGFILSGRKETQGMTDRNIFLDLDGVIADFESHADNTGLVLGDLDYARMDREWWATIPVFDGAFDFYKQLGEYGKVRFLTAVVMHPGCHSGKADWVIRFAGKGKWGLKDLMICARKDKHLLARPGSILIDDNAKNVQSWLDAGGVGIHHAGCFETTLQNVKDEIK